MTTPRINRTASRVLFSTAAPAQHDNESFLTGTSSLYAEQMYENYLRNPNSVHESWKTYFDNVEHGVRYSEGDFSNPTAVPPTKKRQNIYVAVSFQSVKSPTSVLVRSCSALTLTPDVIFYTCTHRTLSHPTRSESPISFGPTKSTDTLPPNSTPSMSTTANPFRNAPAPTC
jgi:2-oxoglutarate dehydrogenase complex dehydrogenase (E1) component-like enzyme